MKESIGALEDFLHWLKRNPVILSLLVVMIGMSVVSVFFIYLLKAGLLNGLLD